MTVIITLLAYATSLMAISLVDTWVRERNQGEINLSGWLYIVAWFFTWAALHVAMSDFIQINLGPETQNRLEWLILLVSFTSHALFYYYAIVNEQVLKNGIRSLFKGSNALLITSVILTFLVCTFTIWEKTTSIPIKGGSIRTKSLHGVHYLWTKTPEHRTNDDGGVSVVSARYNINLIIALSIWGFYTSYHVCRRSSK